MSVEHVIIYIALLVLASVLASKLSDLLGVPALLLFLILGMLAGSEGILRIAFDDPSLAQSVGVFALVLILFSGGLDTEWAQVRPVFRYSAILATLGVFLTALIVGLFAHFALGTSLLSGLLLGSIISSTDAAAVFSILRAKSINLKGQLRPLLELESASNDPMAIILTTGCISLIQNPGMSIWQLILNFVMQIIIGATAGYAMSWLMLLVLRRLKLGYDGLYPVLSLALALLTYGGTTALGGNGFLAVYIAGVALSRHAFIHRKSLLSFHDGLSWLMQIAMFLTLGLLVFPSRLLPVAGTSMLITFILMFLARPISVFISLLGNRFNLREKLFTSWVGLRGAVPVILATYPMIANIDNADFIFNAVFFVVLTSVLVQGTTIPLTARKLGVNAPMVPKRRYPIEFTPVGGFKSELKELPVMHGSLAAGKTIVELEFPDEFLIILVVRDNDFITPSGKTILQNGDTLLVLSDANSLQVALQKLKAPGTDHPAG